MLEQYIQDFTRAARAAGINRVDFYTEETENRSAAVYKGELEQFQISRQQLLFIEGEVDGYAGSVSVEDLRPELFDDLIQSIRQSALGGKAPFRTRQLPQLPDPERGGTPQLPLPELLERLKAAEAAAYAADSRIEQVQICAFHERQTTITLANDAGERVSDHASGGQFYVGVTARDGQRVQPGRRGVPFAWGQWPDMTTLARKAASEAVNRLDAGSYPTGVSPVVLDSQVVCELLDAFLPAFFAKHVLDGTSVLAGREGQQLAGENITLAEEPYLPGGLSSRRFDDEGVPTRAKEVIAGGVLKTFLYNRLTAAQAGRSSSGNGFKQSCAEGAETGYTNMVLRPGEKSREELLREMGDGLLITGVDGVFAGAHPASGDFSLISRGYRVQGGTLGRAVAQITIAGNFFDMLRDVRAAGSDGSWMRTAAGCVRAPSLAVGALAISGKEES